MIWIAGLSAALILLCIFAARQRFGLRRPALILMLFATLGGIALISGLQDIPLFSQNPVSTKTYGALGAIVLTLSVVGLLCLALIWIMRRWKIGTHQN